MPRRARAVASQRVWRSVVTGNGPIVVAATLERVAVRDSQLPSASKPNNQFGPACQLKPICPPPVKEALLSSAPVPAAFTAAMLAGTPKIAGAPPTLVVVTSDLVHAPPTLPPI